MTSRTKPGVAFWMSVVLAASALFVASIGPVCWVSSRTGVGVDLVASLYGPLIRTSPNAVHRVLVSYSMFWAAPRWCWEHFVWLPVDDPLLERMEIRVFWGRDPSPFD